MLPAEKGKGFKGKGRTFHSEKLGETTSTLSGREKAGELSCPYAAGNIIKTARKKNTGERTSGLTGGVIFLRNGGKGREVEADYRMTRKKGH